MAKFDPLRPHALHPGAIQGKEGIKFCHLATLRPSPSLYWQLRRRGAPEDVFHGPHFDELTTEKFATEVAYRHNGPSS